MKNHILRGAVLAFLLVFALVFAGCSGDDGDDGINGIDGIDGVDGVDGEDGADFQLPQGETVGLLNCSTCHGSGTAAADWATSAHANQGSHTVSSCSQSCHNPLGDASEANAAFGVNSPNVVGCESCHGPGSGHFGVGPIPNAEPGTAQCAECHDGSQHEAYHPFASEIASRFETSRHANQKARTAFCSACHSHEGGVALLSMGRMTSVQDLVDAYNPDTVPDLYFLPEGSDTIDGLTTKTCATCHDPHKAALRGEGDILDAEEEVVFSAEFNMCTTCHMVDLDATFNADAGLYEYELSDAYVNINQQDATTETFEMFSFEVPFADGTSRTREVFNTAVFYHDGASGDGRTFADTHFGGDISTQLTEFDGSTGVVTLQGYNINAGGENACTICHDPHTGGKMLGYAPKTYEYRGETIETDYYDSNENPAVGYAEGVGQFHADYLGGAQGHGCTPCHSGDEIAKLTFGGGSLETSYGVHDVVGCRSCHDLAVPNAEPAVNNAEAFAQVREFPADHVFAFNSGVEVDVAELGVNQICFECHKGRTGAISATDEAALPAGETEIREFSYLHYAPVYATLYGVESEMIPLYQDAEQYSGRFVHGGGPVNDVTEFGCVDCHNVHDTDNNNVVENKMITSSSCAGCHEAGGFADAAVLEARTQEFSDSLMDAIFNEMEASHGYTGTKEELAVQMEGRLNTMPTVALAKAANSWKIFTYEEGAVDGSFGVHGHGGSWAHNSKFARQVMFDAIQSLGVDANAVYGLTRPTP